VVLRVPNFVFSWWKGVFRAAGGGGQPSEASPPSRPVLDMFLYFFWPPHNKNFTPNLVLTTRAAGSKDDYIFINAVCFSKGHTQLENYRSDCEFKSIFVEFKIIFGTTVDQI